MAGKELFSERIMAGSRTYFFDVKESSDRTIYLVVSESRQVDRGSYDHNRVMVFEEHISAFHEGLKKAITFIGSENRPTAYTLDQVRKEYPSAYMPWSDDEVARLRSEHAQGKTINELANSFQQKPGAITSRLRKLGLREG